MFKNMALLFILGSASVTNAFASAYDLDPEGLEVPLKKSGRPKKPIITKSFLVKTMVDSVQKTLSIFDDNIRVGAGTSEGRLTSKLMLGLVTNQQLFESFTQRKAGRFLNTQLGDGYGTCLSMLFPEQKDQCYFVDHPMKGRPSYLTPALGMFDKAIGAFIAGTFQSRSVKDVAKEFDKLVKANAVIVSMTLAGYRYQTMHAPQFDYILEEFNLASTMALAGGMGYFLSSVALEVLSNSGLRERLPTFNESVDFMTDVVERSAEYSKRRVDDVSNLVKKTAHHVSAVVSSEVPAFSHALGTLCLRASYELGSQFGEVLHTINALGSLSTREDYEANRQNARQAFGQMAASTTYVLMRSVGRAYNKIMESTELRKTF